MSLSSLSFSSSLSSLALFASIASSSALASQSFHHHDGQPQSPPFVQEVAEAVFVAPVPPQSDSTELSNSTQTSGQSTDSPSNSTETPSASALAGDGKASAPIVAAYYPDWAASRFPPEKVDFSRFDWIDYAFAIPQEDLSLGWDDPNESPKLLERLVDAAHKAGKKVKLSVGGWTGSGHFSSAVQSEESRKTFVDNLAKLYKDFNLDGIDLDWEYPGREGADENEVDEDDSANLLLLLQTMREVLPANAVLTAATLPTPFADAHGKPMEDVSEFAKVLDWILLMNYDVWNSSSEPGSNAPLYDGCQNSTQPEANAVSAYNAWNDAGFPASKLVLGIPSYGYVSDSAVKTLRTRRVASRLFKDVTTRSDDETIHINPADGGGQVQFREIVKQGALTRNETDPRGFSSAGGFERHWDGCSGTPFLRSEEGGQIVTYDDAESLAMKAQFAKEVGMLGVNMFSIDGDTDEWYLTDAVRNVLQPKQ